MDTKLHSYQELYKMKIEDLHALQRKLRTSTLRRINALKKAGFNTTPATEALNRHLKSLKKAKVLQVNPITGKPNKTPKNKAPKKTKGATIAKAKRTKVPAAKKPGKVTEADRKRLIAEIIEYEAFLQMKTSTVKGQKDFEAITNERLGDLYKLSSEEQKKALWRLYEEKRDDIEAAKKDESGRIQLELVAVFLGENHKYITEKRREELQKIYDGTLVPRDDPDETITYR